MPALLAALAVIGYMAKAGLPWWAVVAVVVLTAGLAGLTGMQRTGLAGVYRAGRTGTQGSGQSGAQGAGLSGAQWVGLSGTQGAGLSGTQRVVTGQPARPPAETYPAVVPVAVRRPDHLSRQVEPEEAGDPVLIP